MKCRHTLILTAVCLPVCILLRILQLIFTIDSVTGFVKQQYSAISTVITVVIFAAIAAVGVLGYFADEPVLKTESKNYAVCVTSFALSGVFLYSTLASLLSLTTATWYDLFLILLGVLSAASFAAYGVRNIYCYNFPNVLLVIPVFYYVIRLISIFVSTSALALVSENVFLIFTNSALLFFLFEFSKIQNNIDEKVNYKKLFASAVISVALCLTQSVPKIVLQFGEISACDRASAMLNAIMALFVLSYILTVFSDKTEQTDLHKAKHLAE